MSATPITVTIRATSEQTSLLVRQGQDERLAAKLGSPRSIHRLALTTLLEGLSLWFQSRLHVALIADSELIESWTGLVDGLGFGLRTLHFEVEQPPRPDVHLEPVRLRCRVDVRDARRWARMLEGR
ncbi:MAG TPA: hypothetical protein VEK07_25510 [Polyangiaceae bacterium]|nr:hypothetical protein [Polyangiaceae bacterium]